jgi:hypothetical protein
MNRTAPWLALAALTALSTGCEAEHMTKVEALDALAQVNQSSRGEAATGEVIEVSTDVTIGDALQSAAERIAAFWESQAPCSEVTLEGAKLTVDYGTLDDACTFDGHTYAGVNTVEVVDTERGSLQVDHDWSGFTNGEVTVDGGATVTWTGEDASRRVVTEHTWSDSSGAVVDVVGDHVQGPLEEDAGWAGWLGGIRMDGTRDWSTEGETWSLDMTELELRWIDPAPQAGSLTVTNPDGKTLDVLYERVDETTISATLIGLREDVVVHIGLLGTMEEVD